jgi:hypothetical protein
MGSGANFNFIEACIENATRARRFDAKSWQANT